MPSLERMAVRAKNDRQLAALARVYYILQSDILTEVDEFSSDTILSDRSSNLVAILSSNPPEVMRPLATSPSQATVNTEIESNSDGILWLRSHMNKILSLYTPVQAYARPHQLKDLVFGLAEDLRLWYQSLPMERQFPRDIMTFTLHGASFPLGNAHRDLALRYFACVFFLHRPVLYFFLHKDMEDAIQPPPAEGAASDHSPWVWESCRDCIESAVLIIQICQRQGTENPYDTLQYWPEYQLLFASYLILLQVRTRPSLEPYLRILGSIDRLLDMVEEVFRTKTYQEPVIQKSLLLLVDARHNLDQSSQT
uniref:Transcription factor domain-containing protein n=1 Tax=Bionectria ochroleuca TaxID=29856 RepID=A0A0B7KEA6_BIOOC